MIILDTNIVSEFMTSPPQASVLSWLNEQDVAALFITSISIAEIKYGLSILPIGKRRLALESAFTSFVDMAFQERVLPFDQIAAYAYGDILANQRQTGKPMSCFDGQIASIARVFGYALATRNIKDFSNCEIELINPFEY
ncbi:MAG: type II toxin-antitoxin system VapC family toxin [Kangiellaceae bacterium]|nr:type II toxin-antitoxin system VapC family toxin [Kangiellaceae bacterium]